MSLYSNFISHLCLRLHAPQALCFRVVLPSALPSLTQIHIFPTPHGPIGPTLWPFAFSRMSVRPSIRPDWFPGISGRTHGGIGLLFGMMVYPDYLQNWLDYGCGLLIFLFWRISYLVKRVKFEVSGHFLENARWDWPVIWHADVSWPPSELIRAWLWSLDFPPFGAILT